MGWLIGCHIAWLVACFLLWLVGWLAKLVAVLLGYLLASFFGWLVGWQTSTENLSKIDPSLVGWLVGKIRPKIFQKSIQNRAKIDEKSTKNRSWRLLGPQVRFWSAAPDLNDTFLPFLDQIWTQNWSKIGSKSTKKRKNTDSKINFEVDNIC